MKTSTQFCHSRREKRSLRRLLALATVTCSLAALLCGCGKDAKPNYHTLTLEGEEYTILDQEYQGDLDLKRIRFVHENSKTVYPQGDIQIPLSGDEPPENFRCEGIMSQKDYQTYCETWGMTPAFPDHEGSYAVLACLGFAWDEVDVQVADASVEGDTLRLLMRDHFHSPSSWDSLGFVLTVPVPASVTKLESLHVYTQQEEKNLKEYGSLYSPNETAVAEKPVIYLYPEEETNVTVKLDYSGRLTCTYPAYQTGWAVTAAPDGTLTDENGMTYNYLYWEGVDDTVWDFSKGFCVRGEDTAAFLEDALEKLGLNRREANEFIVYWLPRMEANPWNLISFQGQNYTDSAKLTVSPAPDTVIRVFMAWKGLDAPVEIEPQTLTAPARTGFTVVEWGGSGK